MCTVPYLADLSEEERRARIADLARTRLQIHKELRGQLAEAEERQSKLVAEYEEKIAALRARVGELESEKQTLLVKNHLAVSDLNARLVRAYEIIYELENTSTSTMQ